MNLNEILSLVSYDPESGEFRWAASRPGCRDGDICGTYDKRGYRVLTLKGRKFFAHRVAWFIVNGEWPKEIDHANCVKDKNRISNLRKATRSQNAANIGIPAHNKSGVKGVCFDNERGKWLATINVSGRRENLGRFDTKEAAATAYAAAALTFHGQFARLS